MNLSDELSRLKALCGSAQIDEVLEKLGINKGE